MSVMGDVQASPLLKAGYLAIQTWHFVRNSPEFAHMRNFSSAWYRQNRSRLKRYRKWVADDPIDSWSRAWEYVWCFGWVQSIVQASDGASVRVLDAGSGVTFFPHYLAVNARVNVTCVDSDPDVARFYRSTEGTAHNVYFVQADIADLGALGDASCDAIYCISVLEHMPDSCRAKAVDELCRVLRPGGRLLLTLDVCLDDASDVKVTEWEGFVELLLRRFRLVAPTIDDISYDAALAQGLMSTEWIAHNLPHLLPWKRHWRDRIGLNRQLKRRPAFFSHLLCTALVLERPASTHAAKD
jgi:SAM-dependent methyltransferase